MNEHTPKQGSDEEERRLGRDECAREAIATVRAGEKEAFGRLVELHQAEIMSLSVALLRDVGAAEELTQDAFVRAYRHLDSFDNKRPFFPWLAKIAYRLAQTRRRQQARRAAVEGGAQSEQREASCDADPLTKLVEHERKQRLWGAVRALPIGERAAVVLYYRHGMGVREVGRVLGVSTGTVKTYLFRARQHLRHMLGQAGGGSSERQAE